MNLGDRRRRQGGGVELGEQLGRRCPERPLDHIQCLLGRKWRHLILELGELVGDRSRQQIPTGGESLAEFDEDGPQLLQGTTDTYAKRLATDSGGAQART